jgi:outer membrane biosynthesis protein TonB
MPSEVVTMKKISTFIVGWVTVFLLFASAQAVDRSPRNGDSDQKKETTEIKEGKVKRSGETARKITFPSEKTDRVVEGQGKVETKTTEGKEKYDYFLDRNNNGIDDRLEGNFKAKETKKPEVTKQKISPPPEKPAPKSSPAVKPKERVKPQTTGEPKKESTSGKTEKRRESEKR